MPSYTGTATLVIGATRTNSQANWTPGSPSSAVALSSALIIFPTGNYSNYLSFSGFGLAVPSTDTIVGVEFNYSIEGLPTANAATASDSSLLMQLTGPTSSDLAQSGTIYSTSSQTSQLRGSPTNMWGLTSLQLTPAQVNLSSFEFLLSVQVNPGMVLPGSVNVSVVSAATVTIFTTSAPGGGAIFDDDDRIPPLRFLSVGS